MIKQINMAFTLLLGALAISILKLGRNLSHEKKIFTLAVNNGIPQPLALLIVAQAKHETAVNGVPFMSRQFLINNNAFGYGRVPGNKYQQEISGGKHPEDAGHYAKYSTVDNSIMDVIGWYQRRKNVFYNIDDHMSFSHQLKSSGYYTDNVKNYSAGVKKFYQTNIT